MSEISFKSIYDGVSLALHAAFPAVQVHGGNVKQGLNPGDLNVVMPSAGQSKQVGERFLRTPTLDVIYYDKVKDDGKPHFPKSQTFHLCAELQDCAVRILKGCEAANGRYFETEYEERLKDLDGVLIECQTMEQLINLSYGRKYITGDQCHYWAELVRPVRQKAFNWRKSDGNRAAALREAKAAQELAKMGQMALQIAEALRPQ